MEIYSVEVKEFKHIFYTCMGVIIVCLTGSWFWVNNSFVRSSFFDPFRSFSSAILIGMMVITIFYSSYRRKRMNVLNSISDFAVKVKEYTRIYKMHVAWYLLSCLVSCFLFAVTSRNFFFYFALLQLLITLSAYPSRTMFKRDLKNEEVVLY